MSSRRFEQVRQIFHEAAARPPETRGAFVDDACAGDEELRVEVQALLEHDAAAEGFLSEPFARLPVGGTSDPLVGAVVGRYEVLDLIGAGGAGRVYRARQDSPARLVALKLLRGLATPEDRRRFEYEARVLSRLRHPGIAQVYEAGVHEGPEGPVHYLAMEHVPNAAPLTAHVARARLDLAGTVGLFVEACDAVQHGHLRGVVHRDLNPASILVDADGRVKVVNFGAARAAPGASAPALACVAPELLRGDPEEIDARVDVYALGAVLYELLAGRPPLELGNRTRDAAVRAVLEEVPPPPGAARPACRGDLDAIVARALAKDRELRYHTAGELAADLRRWLADEPVAARAPGAFYTLAKFARRNTVLVGAAAVVLVILAAALVAISAMYVSADAARRREAEHAAAARQARLEEAAARADAVLALDEVRLEAERSTAVIDFMAGMLSAADPLRTKGDTLTVLDVLDTAAPRVRAELADRPLVRAILERTLGTTYRSLGRMDEAAAHLREAYALEVEAEHRDPRRRAEAAVELASALWKTGEPAEARALLDGAIKDLEESIRPDRVLLARARLHLGSMYLGYGRSEEGVAVLSRAVEAARTAEHPDPRVLAGALEALGAGLHSLWRLEESAGALEESLQVLRAAYGDDDPEIASKLGALASVRLDQGDVERAGDLLRDTHARMESHYGPDHRNTLIVLINRGDVSMKAGRHAEALALYRQGLAGLERYYGAPQSNIVIATIKIADAHHALGDHASAARTYRRGHDLAADILGADHLITTVAAGRLGDALTLQGRHAEALPVLERAGAALGPHYAERPNDVIRIRAAQAACLGALGRRAEAESLLLDTWELAANSPALDGDRRDALARALAAHYEADGRADLASLWRARSEGP